MPLYTFKCPSCMKVEEIKQSMKAPAPICRRCANASCGIHLPEMERVFKSIAKAVFKGPGFHATDYDKKCIETEGKPG